MCDAATIDRCPHVLLVHMIASEVAGDAGKEIDVGLADCLGKSHLVANLGVHGGGHEFSSVLWSPLTGFLSPAQSRPNRPSNGVGLDNRSSNIKSTQQTFEFQ